MVKIYFFIALFLLSFAGSNLLLFSQDTLPDTIWTKQMDEVSVVKFSPDGKYVFVGAGDNLLQIDANNGVILKTLNSFGGRIKRIEFSPTGDTIICSGGVGGAGLALHNASTGDTISVLYLQGSDYGCEALITPEGKRIITTTGLGGATEPQILVIDIATKQVIKEFVGFNGIASNLQISSDGKLFCFNNFKITHSDVILMNLETYEELKIFENSNASLFDNVFSNDNYTMGYISYQNGIYLWNIVSLNLIKNFRFNGLLNISNGIRYLKFSNDSRNIIFSYFDSEDLSINKIIIWNIDKDSLVFENLFPADGSLDISKNNYIVAYGNYKRMLTVIRPKWNETRVNENLSEVFSYTFIDEILKINFKVAILVKPTVSIYDLSGKFISNVPDNNFQNGINTIEMNLNFLTPGIYLIKINVLEKNYSLKILVE